MDGRGGVERGGDIAPGGGHRTRINPLLHLYEFVITTPPIHRLKAPQVKFLSLRARRISNRKSNIGTSGKNLRNLRVTAGRVYDTAITYIWKTFGQIKSFHVRGDST